MVDHVCQLCCLPAHASLKCCQKGNINIQKPFHWCFKIWMKDIQSTLIFDSQFSSQTQNNTKVYARRNSHYHPNKPGNGATNNKGSSTQWNCPTSTPMTQQYLTTMVNSRYPTQSTINGRKVNFANHLQLTTPKEPASPLRVKHTTTQKDHQLWGCSILTSCRNNTAPQGMADNIISPQPMPITLLTQETLTLGPAVTMQ